MICKTDVINIDPPLNWCTGLESKNCVTNLNGSRDVGRQTESLTDSLHIKYDSGFLKHTMAAWARGILGWQWKFVITDAVQN